MYEQLKQQIIQEGFERVEKDDRLLDIFPSETRAKGVELWVRFNGDVVEIARIILPFRKSGVTRYSFSKAKIEAALAEYKILTL